MTGMGRGRNVEARRMKTAFGSLPVGSHFWISDLHNPWEKIKPEHANNHYSQILNAKDGHGNKANFYDNEMVEKVEEE